MIKINPNLDVLITQIKEMKRLATVELEEHSWQTRPGMEAAKAQAQNQVPVLVDQFLAGFSKTVYKVFVDGPSESVEKFCQLLSQECTVLSVPSMYEDIAMVVKPTMSLGNAFSADAFLRMLDIVGAYARANNVYPEAPIKEPIGLGAANIAELTEIIKDSVRSTFGDRLYIAYTTRMAMQAALDKKSPTVITALILSGVNTSEKGVVAEALFPGQPTFTLELAPDEEVTRSTTAKVFHKMAKTYSKLNNNESISGSPQNNKEDKNE